MLDMDPVGAREVKNLNPAKRKIALSDPFFVEKAIVIFRE
jgi:hypothetical protein